MVDIRLISIQPLAPVPAVAQPPSTQGPTTQAGAVTLPQIPNGTVLTGFVLNRDSSGNPILRTDSGDVVFSSNFFLKIGSEVVIRIQTPPGGQQNAHIVTVNGFPPEIAETQSAFSTEPEDVIGDKPQTPIQQTQAGTGQQRPAQTAATTTTQSAAPTVTLPRVGTTLPAIIVTPAAQTTFEPGTSLLLTVLHPESLQQTQSAPAGSPLAQLISDKAPDSPAAHVLASLLPEEPAQPATTTTAPTSTAATTPQASQQSAQTTIITTAPDAAPATQTAPQQQQPAANIPQQAQPQPQTEPQPQTFPQASPLGAAAPFTQSNEQAANAHLTGPLGQTIIATAVTQTEPESITFESPIGTLRVSNLAPLPQGQQLALRVISVANPNEYTIRLANEAAPVPPEPLTQLAKNWPSLAQLVQVLGGENEATMVPSFTSALAAPTQGSMSASGAQAASQILSFVAALKGGTLREWLGTNNVKALEDKGYSSLLKKAEGEFTQIARQFTEPQPGNWQSAFVPIMAAGELQMLRAFIKREKKKNEDGKPTKDEDTRFVLEVEMSQLGELQMDGLVKRREKNLQFDLIIRSHQPLPSALERDIQSAYTSTGQLTGFTGQLAFQYTSHFPVNPMEDVTPHLFDDVVV